MITNLLVAYDVSSNRKRYRVVKCVKGYGERVQKSVFECKLIAPKVSELFDALKALDLDPSDSIRVYQLEGRHAPSPKLVRVFGNPSPGDSAREWIVD